MTHAPSILSLAPVSLEYFLSLLPAARITRTPDQITVHADVGDAHWFLRGNRWITAAPGFDNARRQGASGTLH